MGYLGLAFRAECDHESCPETVIVAIPDGEVGTTIDHDDVVEHFRAQGWYVTCCNFFCFRHKPSDWGGPAVDEPIPACPALRDLLED